jgi:UPF0716 protein FxsA
MLVALDCTAMWFGMFLLFVAVPLLELALLIKLGQWLGFWPTLALVVVTAAVGVSILHRQSFAAFRRATEALNRGQPPVEPVLDGFMLMLAGGLLVAPGLITDMAGLLLLVPQIRKAVGAWGLRRILASGTVRVRTTTTSSTEPPTDGRWRTGAKSNTGKTSGPVIDGTFERLDEKTQEPGRRDDKGPKPYRNGHARDP